ncbi:MAG: hypothetical protein RLZZ387_538 [Chloroflexota bacterium]
MLRGKNVLLTGAGGGLGRELTRQLGDAGCLLVLTDLPAMLPPPGHPAVLGCVAADLADPQGAATVVAAAMKLAPRIDILINNAGLTTFGRLDDVPPERLERLMQVNLLAPVRLSALLLPAMRARRSGQIVNIASVAGIAGVAGLAPYCTSKFGLRGLGAALEAELRDDGVTVTTVYPFFTRTPILSAESFGAPRAPLPERLVEEPEPVVAEIVSGIKARRRSVYPGRTAKVIALLERVAPWAVRLLAG